MHNELDVNIINIKIFKKNYIIKTLIILKKIFLNDYPY